MASIELELDNAVPHLEIRDGRRVVVINDGTNETVLKLNDRDPWRPAYRLTMALERITNEVREQVRGDAHRGGQVIAAPSEPAPHGPLTGPVAR